MATLKRVMVALLLSLFAASAAPACDYWDCFVLQGPDGFADCRVSGDRTGAMAMDCEGRSQCMPGGGCT